MTSRHTEWADGWATDQKEGRGSMDPDRPATRGGLVRLTARWWDESNRENTLSYSYSFIRFQFYCLSYTCSFAVFNRPLIFVLLLSFSSPLCFLSDFIWFQSIGVLFRTWWLPLSACGCWLTAVGDRTGSMLGHSHRLLVSLAEALYCVCLNVLIVTLTAHTFHTVLSHEGP